VSTTEFIYKGLSQESLDSEYNNLNKISNAVELINLWEKRGEEACALLPCKLDIKYGPDDMQSMDIFPINKPMSPILAFIHGGYWSSRSKSIGRFLAPFYTAAGVNFISIGYRLCPAVQIGSIVEDIRNCLDWIFENAEQFEGDNNQIFVAGHSAGGHLTGLMCSPSGPTYLKGGCSLSGIHDLEPIRLSYLNAQVRLTPNEVDKYSPVRIVESMVSEEVKLPPIIIAVGAKEGKEYLYQTNRLTDVLNEAKQPVLKSIIEDGNHFSVCESFCDPSSSLSNEMLKLIFAPRF
jgi:arylformamidase